MLLLLLLLLLFIIILITRNLTYLTILKNVKRKRFRRISSCQNENMTWKQDIQVRTCHILTLYLHHKRAKIKWKFFNKGIYRSNSWKVLMMMIKQVTAKNTMWHDVFRLKYAQIRPENRFWWPPAFQLKIFVNPSGYHYAQDQAKMM